MTGIAFMICNSNRDSQVWVSRREVLLVFALRVRNRMDHRGPVSGLGYRFPNVQLSPELVP